MEIKEEYTIPGTREEVWSQLNNPLLLRKTIPGCISFDKKSDEEYASIISIKIGPVSAKFDCKIFLSVIDSPSKYKIVGEGKGGIAGFAKGECLIDLQEIGDTSTTITTKLSYVAKANIGGKIARLGNRLIDSSVKKLSKQFFTNFTNELKSMQSS